MKCIDVFVNKEKQLLLLGEVVWKGRTSLEMIQSHLMSRKIRHCKPCGANKDHRFNALPHIPF